MLNLYDALVLERDCFDANLTLACTFGPGRKVCRKPG